MDKRLHDIRTFAATIENETIIKGLDENGEEFRLTIPTIELLEWLDIDYMKTQAQKYINSL